MSATHTLLLGVALGIASGASVAIAQDTSSSTELEGDLGVEAGDSAIDGDVDAGVTMETESDADAGVEGESTDPVLNAPSADVDVDATGEDTIAEDTDVISAPDGSITVALSTITETDQLVGIRVFDANNEWIGEVNAVMQGDSGLGESLVVDVGGFLGIGEKPVQVEADAIGVVLTDSGAIDFVIVAKTKTQLEAMTEVEM